MESATNPEKHPISTIAMEEAETTTVINTAQHKMLSIFSWRNEPIEPDDSFSFAVDASSQTSLVSTVASFNGEAETTMRDNFYKYLAFAERTY